ncbi:MAG: protease complex subunit PrcB family protein [Elusimicrobia bacterium]|nr:protease complex subunit PrcB family protein [Elusimicrobiota bacterium]
MKAGAALALALALAACGGVPRAPVKEAGMTEATEWKGQFSGALQGARRVAQSEAQWRELWAEIGQAAPPAPDFRTRFAAAVLLGERRTGGWRVQWLEPDSSGAATVVRYRELKPDGMALQALTQPYAVKVFLREKPEVRVEAAD